MSPLIEEVGAPVTVPRALARGVDRTRVAKTIGRVIGRGLLHAVIIAGCIGLMFPFVWMVSTSLKLDTQVYKWPPQWIPNPIDWQNYPESWRMVAFPTFYKNTIIITGLNILGTLISCSLAAFGFARMRFRGREVLFLVVLSTMMLPGQVTLIPLYVIFARLGWVNSFRPLVVPSWFGNAFLIFLLRQFFMTIPRDLDDAALVDGASHFGIYWRIILPLSRTALGVVTIFTFTWNWNDFMGPLLYLSDERNFTIQLGLQYFLTGYYTDLPGLMSMGVVSLIPQLIVFFFAQRYFVQGIVMTGLKR